MIGCFGPTRCMFESNLPVDKASCSYHVLWSSFKRIAERFGPVDRTALFAVSRHRRARVSARRRGRRRHMSQHVAKAQ